MPDLSPHQFKSGEDVYYDHPAEGQGFGRIEKLGGGKAQIRTSSTWKIIPHENLKPVRTK